MVLCGVNCAICIIKPEVERTPTAISRTEPGKEVWDKNGLLENPRFSKKSKKENSSKIGMGVNFRKVENHIDIVVHVFYYRFR